MTPAEVFRRIVGHLEQTGIPYMLTGSFASSFHGAPRTTQDIDLVIDPTAQQIHNLVAALPEAEYYVDLTAAVDALDHRSQFNIIDLATGWKVDLIIRKLRPFSLAEFDRRQPADLFGLHLFLASAEDIVLSKLEWAKIGQSQRQIEDVAGLLRIRAAELDRAYIAHWVRELGLADEWNSACRLAGISP